MLATLRGKLTRRETDWIIIDVAGVGFQVLIPLSTFYKLPSQGEQVQLFTSMIVREDLIALYGFYSQEEQRLFQKLISVSKVGPKLAINLLSGIESHDLIAAIQSENVFAIKAIPGVGLKTAERIILELKGKIADIPSKAIEDMVAADGGKRVLFEDVLSALMALGYKRAESEKALKKALSIDGDTSSMEALVKQSLNVLAKRDK